ncbi:MAG: hypothetical protein ACTSWN_01890 [Promethearchaeota archaeon]
MDDSKADLKTSPLEKIMEILGISEPDKKIKKLLDLIQINTTDLDQGSFDIQAIYTEIESKLKEMGLERVEKLMNEQVKNIISNINFDNLKETLARLKIKDGVKNVKEFLEKLNPNIKYEDLEKKSREIGIPEKGAMLKQWLEESVIQERIEDFETYLKEIGIDDPNQKIQELLDACGIKEPFDKFLALIGWNRIIPL